MSENNFWNTCPRQLEYRPESPCTYACDWRILSKQNNNCFWTYIHNNSRSDGNMKELQPQEIAKLLGTTTSKINEEIEQAEDDLRILLFKEGFKDVPEVPGEEIGPIIIPEKELEDRDAFDIIIEDI